LKKVRVKKGALSPHQGRERWSQRAGLGTKTIETIEVHNPNGAGWGTAEKAFAHCRCPPIKPKKWVGIRSGLEEKENIGVNNKPRGN